MCPMELYAIRRLMLLWLMAANAPSTMDAMATNTTICCHWAARSPNGPIMMRRNSASAAIFGPTEKNAVTGVGAPS